jgi:LPXTG-motif cell wall-anchored protein
MNNQTLVAMILLVAGVLGLAYGGFTYTKASHQVDLGVVQLSVDEKEHVNVPLWAGIGLLVAGGALLVGSRKNS